MALYIICQELSISFLECKTSGLSSHPRVEEPHFGGLQSALGIADLRLLKYSFACKNPCCMLGWNTLDLPSVETILDEISQRTQKQMHNFLHNVPFVFGQKEYRIPHIPLEAIAQLHCAAMGVSCLSASARSRCAVLGAVPRSDEWMPLYRDWCDGRSFNALLKDGLQSELLHTCG